MNNKTKWESNIIEKTMHTKDMVVIPCSKPEGFTYKAGQFVQWDVPDKESKNGIVKRSYSLASSPHHENLSFCIKIKEDGKAGKYVTRMDKGDTLVFEGPQGRFCCNEETDESLFFIATGAGIAPIIGMIEDQLENKKTDKRIHLLFGLRFENDIFWQEKIDHLLSTYNNFSYQITLSRPEGTWDGLKGRVTEHLHEHDGNHSFYLCGSLPMVKDVREILKEKGVDMKSIHFEIF